MRARRWLVFVSVLLLGGVVVAGILGRGDWQAVGGVVLFMAACGLLIPSHEMGHALIARLVGLSVARVVVGIGPVLKEWRVGKATWQVNVLPFGGMTIAVPATDLRFVRLRHWLVALGGPLADACVAWLAWKLGARFTSGAWALNTIASAATVSVVINLFPARHRNGQVMLASDGLQLLRIPFLRPAQVKELFASYYAVLGSGEGLAGNHAAALDWFDRGITRFPEHFGLRLLRAFSLSRLGRFREAKLCAAEALKGPLEPAERALVLNDWSWHAFVDHDERDLAAADRRSAEALALNPTSGHFVGTRGAVLLWQGRVTEAIDCLERSYAASSATPLGRSSDGALLAIAHTTLGQTEKARAYRERAKRDGPTNPMVAEAEAFGAEWSPDDKTITASRGRRTLIVGEESLEVRATPTAAGRCIPFSDVTRLTASATARGRGRVALSTRDGVSWHLPLELSALPAARLKLHRVFSRHPAAPPLTRLLTPSALNPLRLGQVAAIALTLAMLLASGGFDGLSMMGGAVVMMMAFVAATTPGPALLVGVGSAALISLGTLATTADVGTPAMTSLRMLWLVLEGVAGGLALVAGWQGARSLPDRRKEGLRWVVGLSLIPLLPGSAIAVLSLVKGTRPLALGAVAAAQSAAGIAACSLAVVLVSVTAGWRRKAGWLLGTMGVMWLFLGSTSFQEHFVLSRFGPPPQPLTWTRVNATILRRVTLAPTVMSVSVSPSVTSYLARLSSDEASGSTWILGDFQGHETKVQADTAHFLDDRGVLAFVSQGKGELRELDTTPPFSVRATRPLPYGEGDERPRLVDVGPGRDLLIVVPSPRMPPGPTQSCRWSRTGDLVACASGPSLPSQEHLLGVFWDGSEPLSYLVQTWFETDAKGRLVSPDRVAGGPHLVMRGPSGARSLLSGLGLQCVGRDLSGSLLCAASEPRPMALVAVDDPAANVRRIATVPGAYPPLTLLADGRVAMGAADDVAVVDTASHRAWHLVLPPKGDGSFRTRVASGGLAVFRTAYKEAKPTEATLFALAPP